MVLLACNIFNVIGQGIPTVIPRKIIRRTGGAKELTSTETEKAASKNGLPVLERRNWHRIVFQSKRWKKFAVIDADGVLSVDQWKMKFKKTCQVDRFNPLSSSI